MPEILSRPSAVLWDKTKGGLLYVFYVFNVSDDPRKGKLVIAVNYNLRFRPGGTGKSVTKTINNVKTAGMVSVNDLKDTNSYYRIDGNL